MAEEKKDAAKKEKKGRKKEEVKKAGYAANIEEGVEAKPARLKLRYRKEIVAGTRIVPSAPHGPLEPPAGSTVTRTLTVTFDVKSAGLKRAICTSRRSKKASSVGCA